jgi:hypothetical protein
MSSIIFAHCAAKAAFCFIAPCTAGLPVSSVRVCPAGPVKVNLGKTFRVESKVPPEPSPRMVIEPVEGVEVEIDADTSQGSEPPPWY